MFLLAEEMHRYAPTGGAQLCKTGVCNLWQKQSNLAQFLTDHLKKIIFFFLSLLLVSHLLKKTNVSLFTFCVYFNFNWQKIQIYFFKINASWVKAFAFFFKVRSKLNLQIICIIFLNTQSKWQVCGSNSPTFRVNIKCYWICLQMMSFFFSINKNLQMQLSTLLRTTELQNIW